MNSFRSGALAPSCWLKIAGFLLLAASAGTAVAVNVQFDAPATYTPGDTTASYTITITNPDASTVSVDVATAFPTGVTLGTPACNNDNNSGSCGTSTNSGNLDATATIAGNNEFVVYTLPVTFDSDLTTDPLPFNASVDQGGTVTSSSETSALALVSDLEITSMDADGATDYIPGSTGTFNIEVLNNGPADAIGATLTETLPTGVTVDGWNCAEETPSTASCPSPVASGGVVNPFDLPAGGGLTFTLDVRYAGDLRTDPDPLTVGAEIAAAAGVTDDTSGANNNTASVDLAQNARVDLAVSMTPNSPSGAPTVSYIPGTPNAAFPGLPDAANELTVTIANVANAGTQTLSDALGAEVQIDLPGDVETAGWTCADCYVTSGSEVGGQTITVNADIPSGDSIDIVIDLAFESAALADPLQITASATEADDETDTSSGNDSATNGYTLDRRASITVEKVANSDTVNPLAEFFYTITVTNEGPSDIGQAPAEPDGSGGFVDVDGILLTDILPAGLLAAPPPSCSGDGDLPCFVYCPSDAGETGDTVRPDSDPTCGSADIEPETVSGSVIAGNPDSPPIRLAVSAGKSSEVRLSAVLGQGFGTGDQIVNTASIQLDPASGITEIVPSPDDGNEDSATITVALQTDLVVTKTDRDDPAIPGELQEYTITVFNDGNQNVSGVRVTDSIPGFPTFAAGFVPNSTTWQCSAQVGACCNSGTNACGVGQPVTLDSVSSIGADGLNLDHLIDLDGQTGVTFTVTGRIDRRSTVGPMQTSTSALLPTGILEENPDDNIDVTEPTDLVPTSDLRITKELERIEGDVAPFKLTYLIEIANAGPSFAADATVTDSLDDGAFVGTRGSAVWTCSTPADPNGGSVCQSGTGQLNATVDIDVDALMRFELVVDTNASAAGEITNTASVASVSGSDSIMLDSNLEATADLELIKTDNREWAIPGTEHEYVITVQNQGPDPVFNARVIDEFPAELENAVWSCEATTPIPGDLEEDFLIGAVEERGGALLGTADGFHVYQLQPDADSVAVYLRNSVPGVTFGAMNEIEVETNGQSDNSDAGGVVENMENPVDLALSPDQRHVYVLSDPPFDSVNNEQPPPAIVGFVRTTNVLAGDFGRLSYADSFIDNVPANPTAIAVTSENVFVAGGSGEIAIFERSVASGLLTYLDTTTADVPPDPSALAVDRGDNVLAVASGSGVGVAFYAINNDDSSGTPIGQLSHVDTASDLPLAQAVSLEIAPEANHLYVIGEATAQVSLIRYDEDGDGVPNLPSPAVEASFDVDPPSASALAPDGEHLLVLSENADTLTEFRRDVIGGGLSRDPIPNSDPQVPEPPLTPDQPLPGDNAALDAPQAVAFTSDGRHVLVSASGGASLRALAVYTRRAPDPLFELIEVDREGDPKVTGSDSAPFIDSLEAPTDIAVSPDGQHVYAVSLAPALTNPPAGTITVFKRDAQAGTTDATVGAHLEFQQSLANGEAVDDAAGNPVNITGMPEPQFVLVSPNGESVYVTSEDSNTLIVFDRNDEPTSSDYGNLTYRGTLTDGDSLAGETIDGLSGARGMAMDSASNHLYVAGGFDDAVAVFRRQADKSLEFVEAVLNGIPATSGGDPVNGLDGIRDVAVTPDGEHLYAASETSDAVAVFSRTTLSSDSDFGRLRFVQRVNGVGDRPMSIDVSPDGSHVYVAAQNSNSVSVLRRVVGSGDPASFGRLVPVETLVDGIDLDFMRRPRDVTVSPDGNRVYVAAQGDGAVLVFDRDRNATSDRFGTMTLSAISRDGVNGVDGLDNVYAVAVATGSRNVYAIGFDDRAVASFVLGIGSICTGSGSGSIDDLVTIGNGGTLEYRIRSRIRPDASGILENTARVELPDRVTDPDDPVDPGDPNDRISTDNDTRLYPVADLALTKTNDQVSVTAGEPVTYEIEITNLGPSNLTSAGDIDVAVTDMFSGNTDFVPGSVTWSCEATGSGALTFADSLIEDTSVEPQPAEDNLGLEGVAATALVADSDGAGKLGEMLATVGVTDDALSLFARDPGDGSLTFLTTVVNGDTLGAQTVDTLDGARDVYAGPDGRFLYVVSQVDDALTVFAPRFVEGDPVTTADDSVELDWVQAVTGQTGLDQPSDVTGSADGKYLYVAGSNDDAIAVFEILGDGTVSFEEAERDGIDDPGDPGGAVQGLNGVSRLIVSPDGLHLYAVSATARAVAQFDRDPATGLLSWAAAYPDTLLDVRLDGASGGAMDGDGRNLYITSSVSDRIVALSRDHVPTSATFGALAKVEETVLGEGGVAGLVGPRAVTVSDDGFHVYAVAQSSNAVTWYLRDPATGALTFSGLLSNQSSNVSGLGGASDLVLDPDRDVLYVAGTLDAAVARFERSNDSRCTASGSGDLDEEIDIAAGGTVTFLVTATVSPDIGTDSVVNEASVVATNSATGPPTPPPIDPNNVNNQQEDTDVVEVVADLRITKEDPFSEFDGLAGATAMAGTANAIYVSAATDEGIGVFSRDDATGKLEFVQALKNGQGSVSGLTDAADVELSGDGAHVYAVSPTDNTIVTFDRNSNTGELTFAESLQNTTLGVTGLGGAIDIALSPSDAHLYVAGSLDNSIAVFRREEDPLEAEYGRLTFVTEVQNGADNVTNLSEPLALSISGDGLHLYAVSPVDASVVLFSRNPNPGSSNFGSLTFEDSYADNVGGVFGLDGAADIVIAPNDEDVYVLGAAGGTLARFKRSASTGDLSFVDFKEDGTAGTTGLAGASAMRISPDGLHLYVASTASDAIVRFDIATDGSLSFASIIQAGDPAPLTSGQVLALDGVRDILVEPAGSQLYSVSALDDAIATFPRDAAGDLDYLEAIFDGLGGVSPGSPVTYTIVVENLGPSDVLDGVTVTDDFPDTFSSVSWTCTFSQTPRADCTASGTGSINDEAVELPVGGRVTYEATGIVREDASGRLINTATVSAVGLQDPVIANNSATDDDTVLSPRVDLVTTVETVDPAMTEATPGEQIEYDVTIRNAGPSLATDVRIRDAIPPELFDVAWSCSATPVEGLLSSGQLLTAPLTVVRDLIVPGGGPFAYAAGDLASGAGAVVVYLRDSVTGELREIETYAEGTVVGEGTPTITGLQGASAVAVSGDGSLLFAAGAASDSLVVFERDSTSGLLTYRERFQDGDFGIDGLGGVADLFVSPVGPFLYAASRIDDAIAVFRIGAGTNGLAYTGFVGQGDPGVDGLNGVSALAWDQGYLLAVAEDNNSLAAFEPSPTDGLLTPAAIVQNFQLGLPSPAAPLNAPTDLLMAGDRILVAATGGQAISEFKLRIDPDTTPNPTAEFDFVQAIENGDPGISGLAPDSLAWAPRQQRLYASSADTDTVHLFNLRGDAPALLADYDPADLPGLNGVSRIRIPVVEGPLYGLSEPGGIAVLARQRGSLCPLEGERQLGSHPVEIAGNGGQLDYRIEGTIFPNATGTLFYEVSADVEFVEREQNFGDNTGDDTLPLTPKPDLSVVKSDGLTEVFAGTGLTYTIDIANAGPSDAIGAQFTDNPPIHPTDPGFVSGSATWSCSTNPPLSADFTLLPSDIGELAGINRVALSAGGARLLATNASTDSLLIFAVDPVTGGVALERTISEGQQLSIDDDDPVAGLVGASAVAESRDGQFIYVVGETANSIVVLEREPAGGYRFRQQLQSGTDGVFGLLGPQDVVLSPDERFVYVAATGSDAVTIFTRNDDTGLLTFVDRVKDGFGTIVPDSNVILGVRRLHVSVDGRFLYTVAPDSDSVATFAIDDETGALEYLGALQSGDPGVTGMNGAWDLAASPGDSQLYVAGRSNDAIVILARDANTGALAVQGVIDGLPGLLDPVSLTLDASGSRLYAAAGNGRLHVFARDWIDGALDFRGWVDSAAGVPPAPVDLAHQVEPAGLYIADTVNGSLTRINELALSRCLTSSGTSDNVSILLDLGVDGDGEILYSAIVDPAARGLLTNLAELQPGVGQDFDPSDNQDTDGTTVKAKSEIGVTKSGPAQAVAGETITYDIVVTNTGPSDALGIVVTDTPPAPLQQIEWTCSATLESTCPASGTGAPDFTATVRVDGQLTISMSALIDPSFIGPMTNSVELTPEPGSIDPTEDDWVSAVTTNVIAVADVRTSKVLTTGPVVAGETVGYRLTAVNDGPSDAPVVALTDLVPTVLSNVSWTCLAIGGASCPASGIGDIQFDADLPVGSSVEILVTAFLAPSATGSLSNTFSAVVAAPVTDPDTGNNQATSVESIAVVPDLVLMLADPLDPFDPAGTIPMPYVITLTNAGPSLARNIQVAFDTSDPVVVDSPSCNNVAVGFRCATGPLQPGEVRSIDLRLLALPSAPRTLTIDGLASTSGDDPDLGNNVATTDTELVNGADLNTTLTNNRSWVTPGEPLTYELVIGNIGSVAAPTVDVDLPIATELLSPSWTCAGSGGAICGSSGIGDLVDIASIPSGGSVAYALEATVDPALDLTTPQSVLMSGLGETDPPGDDINPANNLAVDEDDVRLVMFADGFESPVLPPQSVERFVDSCIDLSFTGPAPNEPLVMTGKAASGQPLFRVELRRQADRDWVRWTVRGLRSVETAGWQHWSDGPLIILVEDGVFGARIGEWPTRVSSIPFQAPLTGIVAQSGAFDRDRSGSWEMTECRSAIQ